MLHLTAALLAILAGVTTVASSTQEVVTVGVHDDFFEPETVRIVAGVSSTGGCNSVLEFSGWGHEAEGLTGAGVQFQGDAVQVLLAVR